MINNIRLIFIAAIAIILMSASNVSSQNQYTNKFDTVDVDSVLNNGRILQNYIKCLLEKGPCTQEGRELKRLLPDALATDCSKCTEVQKTNSNKVIGYLRKNRAQDWDKLLTKYDPKGVYQSKYGQTIG